MMCQEPPWGELVAVNVNTGDIAWRVPLGVTDSLPTDKQKTGRPGNGGTITTASGLVFVGATDDSRFRAFDARTGQELWTVKLGAAAHAVPMTYQGGDGRPVRCDNVYGRRIPRCAAHRRQHHAVCAEITLGSGGVGPSRRALLAVSPWAFLES